jgi:hypothetical protein
MAPKGRTKVAREQRGVAQIHTRFRPASLDEYLAVMSRAVFQAGLSWAQIDRQWERLAAAFEGFDPELVARYADRDVARIGRTPGIVHSERKVRATIHNARTLLALAERHGSLRRYLGSFKNYGELCADIKDRFAYVGDISVYYFLFRVGEKVPPFARWITTVKGEHPRIAEMVKRKGAT